MFAVAIVDPWRAGATEQTRRNNAPQARLTALRVVLPSAEPTAGAEANAAPAVQRLDIGPYRIERPLGAGAIGRVFVARERASGALVALKTVALDRALDEHGRREVAERFEREAHVLRGLDHPGIVRLLDAGSSPRLAWMAMELVRGTDLRRYGQRTRLLPDALVAHIGVRLAGAIAHAHARGVVHRDIKPANVLVDFRHDVIKLSDFGIALVGERSQTRSGVVVGSPEYMAPEQLSGSRAGPAADVYALGATLFELLCGRRPHEAASLGDLLRSVATAAPAPLHEVRPDLPQGLCRLVMQALSRESPARPTADELAVGLSPWARALR